jgi:transketolase
MVASAGLQREAQPIPALAALSRRARRLILESVHTAGAGHIGGPLSVTDLLVSLYFAELRIDPADPVHEHRDRLILSKGHSSIALYTVMALRGYMPIEELATFDQIDSRLQGHPDLTALPGIDMSTGSLGQGLSAGIGMALGARLKNSDFHTWVILGDGEIQEGQVWEAAFVAARYKLNNVTAIVDANDLPQFGWPDSSGHTRTLPFDDPAAKFRAFGWNVIEVDGHDHTALVETWKEVHAFKDGPTCVIAKTIKGKGVSFMEGNYLWHAQVPTQADLDNAGLELADPEER